MWVLKWETAFAIIFPVDIRNASSLQARLPTERQGLLLITDSLLGSWQCCQGRKGRQSNQPPSLPKRILTSLPPSWSWNMLAVLALPRPLLSQNGRQGYIPCLKPTWWAALWLAPHHPNPGAIYHAGPAADHARKHQELMKDSCSEQLQSGVNNAGVMDSPLHLR